MKLSTRLYILGGFSLVALLVTVLVDPIAQDLSYHNFADQRQLLGIPNFWNVISNLPFLLLGLAGGFILRASVPTGGLLKLRPAYSIFFAGVAFTAFGSGYYHLNPNNETLVWDRLSMSVAFMAFFSIVISEYISLRWGRRLLLPLLIVGLVSVYYWSYTEAAGQGDLRPYGLVQFLPALLIPAILLMFPSPFGNSVYIWAMLGCYLVAKLTEFLDVPLFEATGMSGHAIKHLAAAGGGLFFYLALLRRKRFRFNP